MKLFSIKTCIIYILILNTLKNECAEGCLSCNDNKQCQLCDLEKNWVLSKSGCLKSEISNCKKIISYDKCLLCQNGFFLDQGKCVEISSNFLIQNCLSYANIINCTSCETDFFILEGKCQKVENSISNCKTNASEILCGVCQIGYFLSLDNKNCLEIRESPNCQAFSLVECLGCKEGFFSQENFLEKKFEKLANSPVLADKIESMTRSLISTFIIEEKCFAVSVSNCKVLEDFNTCSICNDDYYLENSQCVLNPKDLIPFCFHYRNDKECQSCIQGYFLSSSSECKPVIYVPSCIEYSTTSDKSNCIKCEYSHFLKDINICEIRQKNILNCSIYNDKKDSCQKCSNNLELTDDNQKCLSKINNCKKYFPNSIISPILKCDYCIDSHYLNNQTCQEGTSPNCERFRQTENKCEKCQNEYYLDNNNNCQKHDKIIGCEDYNKDIKNKCNTCAFNTVLFTSSNKCLPVDLYGCDIHSTKDKCIRCDDGFMLSNDHSCTELDEALNCVRGEYDVCKLCRKGYVLEFGACSLPFEYLVKNCDRHNLSGLVHSKNSVCETCVENSIPLNYRGKYLCVKNEKIVELLGNSLNVACKAYKLNTDGIYQCDLCAGAVKTVVGESSCETTICPDSKYVASFSVKNDLINVENVDFCGPKVGNCAVLGPLLDQKNLAGGLNYGCTQCDTTPTNFMKIEYGDNGEIGNTTVAKAPTNLYSADELNSDKFYGIANFECADNTGIPKNLLGVGTTIGTENLCQYYTIMPDNEMACVKCQHQNSGIVKNYKYENCFKYDNEKKECSQCNPGYKFETTVSEGNRIKCIEVTVTNCRITDDGHQHSIEDLCYNCDDTHFLLSDNTCSTTERETPTNCEILSGFEDKCEKCLSTHILGPLGRCTLTMKTNCLEYDINNGNCTKCKDTFFIDSSTNSCVNGDIDDCLIYNQTPVIAENKKCLQFKTKIPFLFTNSCEAVVKISNCKTYATKNECSECDKDFYLFNKISSDNYSGGRVNCCVGNGKFGICHDSDAPVVFPTGNNCLKAASDGSKFTCEECLSDYHKDKEGTDDEFVFETSSFNYKCVKDQSYFSPADKSVKIKIDLVDNTENCDVYNFLIYKCVKCKTKFYNSNNLCCLTGINGTTGTVNIDNSCIDISEHYSNDDTLKFCLKVDSSNSQNPICLECDSALSNPELLTNGHCCIADNYYSLSAKQCKPLPYNCEIIDEVTGICETCKPDYYKTDEFNNCCKETNYSVGTTETEADDCKKISDIPIEINNCKRYNNLNQICEKCSENFSWDKFAKVCVKTEKIYENCLEVGTSEDDKNQCKTCKSTHFFHISLCCLKNEEYFNPITGLCDTILNVSESTNPIEFCSEHSTITICSKCDDSYYLVNSNKNCCKKNSFWLVDTCVSIPERIKNCAHFDFTEKKCLICAGDYSNTYYLSGGADATKCCLEGTYENSSDQICTNSTKFCKEYNQSGDCEIDAGCEKGYYVNSNDCVKLPENCLEATEAAGCTKCVSGYYTNGANSGAVCQKVDFSDMNYFFTGTYKCQKGVTNSTDIIKCETCSDFYFLSTDNSKSVCCPNGYYFKRYEGCVKSEDELCSKPKKPDSSEVKSNCQEGDCFLNKDYCTRHKEQVYKLTNGFFSPATYLTFTYVSDSTNADTKSRYYEENYSNGLTTPCCEIGKYYMAIKKQCIPIPILNCDKYDNGTCRLCKSNFKLINGKCCGFNKVYDYYYHKCVDIDSKISCEDDSLSIYMSNGTCCLEKTYYDISKDRCMPLFDQNCLESDDDVSCNKCKDNFIFDKEHVSLLELNLYNEEPCINPNIRKEINLCVDTSQMVNTSNQIIPYKEMIYITKNCKEFDFVNKLCKICESGAYKTENYPFCCLNGSTGITIEGIKKCIEIKKLMENCFNYDIKEKKCRKCKDENFHLIGGRCCPNKKFLNITTMECDIIDQPQCLTFNLKTSNCTQCKSNAYFSKGHCCTESEFWDESLDTPACVNTSINCKILRDNDLCGKCDDTYYLTNGHCCKEEFFWKGSCTEINTESGLTNDKGFNGCEFVDDSHNCLKCLKKTLSSGRCCDDGKYFNGSACTALAPVSLGIKTGTLLGCIAANQTGLICTACENGKYLADFEKENCCKFGKVFSYLPLIGSNAACTDPSRDFNCLEWDVDDGCLVCEDNYSAYRAVVADKFVCKTNQELTNLNIVKVIGCTQYLDTVCHSCSNKPFHGPPNCDNINFCVVSKSDICLKCKSNYVLDANDECISDSLYPNCSKINIGLKCIECLDYFYLDLVDNKCKSIHLESSETNFVNCIYGTYNSTAYECIKCATGYFAKNTEPCEIVPAIIVNCKTYVKTIGDTCTECQSDYYLQNSNKNCCKEGEFFDNYTSSCISIHYTKIKNCSKFIFSGSIDITENSPAAPNISSCEECENEYYKTNGGCCGDTSGEVWDGETCVSLNIDMVGIKDCYRIKDGNFECEILNDLSTAGFRENNCLNNYYMMNKRCCLKTYYWDLLLNDCVLIDTTKFPNCNQLDENGECIECTIASNKYVSNGYCCDEDKYFQKSSSSCEDISKNEDFPGCKKINKGKCELCDTGSHILTSDENCCVENNPDDFSLNSYWDSTISSCKKNPIGCKIFNNSTKECTTCKATSNIYKTPLACCAPGTYFNLDKNNCVVIPDVNNNNCQQINDSDNISTFICSACTDSEIFMDDKCSVEDTYKILIENETHFASFEIIKNCDEMNDLGYCDKCADDYVKTGSKNDKSKVCCLKGNFFDSSSGEGKCKINEINNCKIQFTKTECGECKETHYLNNDNGSCVEIGKVPGASKITFPNCTGFDVSKNCLSCKNGYKLFKDSNLTGGAICCKEGDFFDFKKNQKDCLPIIKTVETCKIFDYANMECKTCLSTGYKSDFFCCIKTKEWNGKTDCVTIVDDNLGSHHVDYKKTTIGCNGRNLDISNQDVSGIRKSEPECVSCINTKYLSNNGLCCDVTKGSKTSLALGCEDITSLKCNKWKDSCIECLINNNKYTGDNCCPDKQYWNTGATPACKAPINKKLLNCKIFDRSTTLEDGLLCEECISGFLLASDRKSCCSTGQLIANDPLNNDVPNCLDNMVFPLGCKIFDPLTLKCISCLKTYYLIDSVCCEDTKFLTIVKTGSEFEKTCEDINTTAYPNCIQFNNELKICLKCSTTHKLRHSDKICIEILKKCDIDWFNPETQVCTKCYDDGIDRNYYTHGKCCPFGQYNNEGVCTLIINDFNTNTNCVKFESEKCIECLDTHYLYKNFCVTNGEIINSTHDASVAPLSDDVANCLEYGNYRECKKCKQSDGYALINLKNQKTHCLKIIANPVRNCDIFSVNEVEKINQAKCVQCKKENIEFILNSTSSSEKISSGLSLTGCEFYDIKEVLTDSTFQCYSCKDNNLNFFDEESKTCKKRTLIATSNCSGDASVYPLDKDICGECKANFYLNKEGICSKNPTNCKNYDPIKIFCIECVSNFTLFFEKINLKIVTECVNLSESQAPYWFPGYIPECAADEECDSVVYENLSGPLEKLFSCHKCVTDTKIPFVAYQGGADVTGYPTGIQRWDLKAIINEDDSKSKNLNFNDKLYEKSSVCLNSVTGFNIQSSVDFNFPTNCALGLVNSDKKANAVQGTTDNANLEYLSVFCAACKPGYKAKRNISFNLHIYECELITNCLIIGNGLNRCEDCQPNFSWEYNDKKIDYSSCISWENDINCHAVDTSSLTSSDYKCVFCNTGYHLNNDNKCVQYIPPNCTSGNFNSIPYFNSENIISGLNLLPNGQGCSQCDTGYVGLFQHTDNWVCTDSSYLSTGTFVSGSTVYDVNCFKYGISPNSQVVKCNVCKDDFIISIGNKCFAKNSIFENCLIANNESQCFSCENTHIVVNYKCVEKNIAYCVEYIHNPQSTNQSCSNCQDGFYIKNHVCEAGTTKNCKEYMDRDVCTKCFNGYSLVIGKDKKEMCYPVIRDENCLQYDSDDFQHNNIQCKKCDNNNFILVGISEKYICNPFNSIEHCIEYDKQEHIINSSYECVTCHQDFYLNLQTKLCVPRSSIVSNCLENNKYGIKCDLCRENYYLNEEKDKCVLNPEGIPGCAKYTNPTTCKLCNSNLYNYDNLCYPVPEENLIENCLYYLDIKECKTCLPDKILINNKCEDPINKECLTYINSTECSTCKVNFGIKIENEKKTCIKIPPIDNCTTQENTFPFKCLLCKNAFYLDSENICQPVSSQIDKCLNYKNTDTCSKCEKDNLLSSDGKSCTVLNISSNCSSFKENLPFCVLCDVGYTLKSDKSCVKNNLDDGFGENCLFYNFGDNKCLVCRSDYYQNEEFECKLWSESAGVEDLQGFRGVGFELVCLVFLIGLIML